ncbi:cbs domain protein [hydrocarbon metagenome]|uniref:Cbs domain protein n=1 Tax=hydrocarbon metagenome TaxID=938273 RepID=A0A0W8F3Y8_9ZZZZ
MNSPVFVVSPGDTVARARNLMLKHKISRLPVVDEDSGLAGIITKKDIGYRLRQTEPIWRRRPIDSIPVSVLMTPDPVTVTMDASISAVASLMLDRDISGIPVVDASGMVGILTKSDLMKSAMVGALSAHVEDIMEDVITISRYHSLDHVIDLMRERNDKVVVANSDGTLAGIITESNLAFFLYLDEKARLPVKDVTQLRKEEPGGKKQLRYIYKIAAVAEDLMSRPVVTIAPGTTVREAVSRMRDEGINSLVVVDQDGLRGIIKRDDIIREVAQ